MPSHARVFTVLDIITAMDDEHEEMHIQVPAFQRGIVWSAAARSKLVDSIIEGYPIGSILLWQSHRRDDGKMVYALIDGLQRSTSLKMYENDPTTHLQNNWLTNMNGYSDFSVQFPELENLDYIILNWIRELGSFHEATPATLTHLLRDYLEPDLILARMEVIGTFCGNLHGAFSLLDKVIPAVIYDGDREHLGEIFTRINKLGRPLSPLQIIAATWIGTDIQINLEHPVESEIAGKARRRLEAFEGDGYDVLDFNEDDPTTYCNDLFQYLFGLGKLLLEHCTNILPSSSEQDPDILAFYLLGISQKLPTNRLQDIPLSLGANPNLSGFSSAALDATQIVSEWFNWLTDLNLNSVGDEFFIPHSQNQMISIICRVMLEKYDPESWEQKASWDGNQQNLRDGIRIKYLMDILTGYWQGSGDAKLFKHCWERVEPEDNAAFYVLSSAYILRPDQEYIDTQLNGWFLLQMEGRQKTRANVVKQQKIAMKYIYSSLMNVRENAENRYHIEHINSVSHMRQKVEEEESDGWPMNCISNLMLLERNVNETKGATSVRDYVEEGQTEQIENHIRNFLITELDEIPRFNTLNTDTYITYCRDRWPIIKNSILEAFGYPLVQNEQPALRQSQHEQPPLQQSVSAFLINSDLEAPLQTEQFSNITNEYYGEIIPTVSKSGSGTGTPKTPAGVTLECAIEIGKHLNIELEQVSRAKFHSEDWNHAFCTIVSKDHSKDGSGRFWFGCFDHQLKWFESVDTSHKWYGFSCGSPSMIFLCPVDEFNVWKQNLNSRVIPERGNRYWHIHIEQINNVWYIITKKGYENISLTNYRI